MKAVYTIITECVPLLEAELEKLNKRAKKLGCAPLTLSCTDPYMKVRDGNIVENVVDATIIGDPIKLNGWRFLGRVEAVPGTENLIFTVPGEKAPDEYRTCSAYRCQHCNQNRLRKYTWIVEHDDGRHMQVGSSCMDDFLNAKNPERAVAWWMGSMDKLLAYLRELELKTAKQVVGGFSGVNRPMMISAYDVLKQACQVVRTRGRYEFATDDHGGTPSIVWSKLFGSSDPAQIEPEDKELADKIVAFVLARKDTADYFKNLSIMFIGDKVSVRNIKFICSSVYTYRKEHKSAHASSKNEHYGDVGTRYRDLQLTVAWVAEVTSDYHENYDYRLIMKDAAGRTFVWKKTSAGAPPKKGDVLKLTGTVVRHDTYKGTLQTVLSRCNYTIEKLAAV